MNIFYSEAFLYISCPKVISLQIWFSIYVFYNHPIKFKLCMMITVLIGNNLDRGETLMIDGKNFFVILNLRFLLTFLKPNIS